MLMRTSLTGPSYSTPYPPCCSLIKGTENCRTDAAILEAPRRRGLFPFRFGGSRWGGITIRRSRCWDGSWQDAVSGIFINRRFPPAIIPPGQVNNIHLPLQPQETGKCLLLAMIPKSFSCFFFIYFYCKVHLARGRYQHPLCVFLPTWVILLLFFRLV